jgi:hypothetical protein
MTDKRQERDQRTGQHSSPGAAKDAREKGIKWKATDYKRVYKLQYGCCEGTASKYIEHLCRHFFTWVSMALLFMIQTILLWYLWLIHIPWVEEERLCTLLQRLRWSLGAESPEAWMSDPSARWIRVLVILSIILCILYVLESPGWGQRAFHSWWHFIFMKSNGSSCKQ